MVQKTQIKSVKSADNPSPWYELEIRNGAPYILTDKDGGTSVDLSETAHSLASFVNLPAPAQKSLSTDAVYAVTESGEYIAYEQGKTLSEHGVSLRAHLAWYDSDADEFTVLEFVEE